MIVTTSNRPPDDLYKDGLNRAAVPALHRSAARTRLEVHELESETDYRRTGWQGAQVYFTPAGPRRRGRDRGDLGTI